MLKSILKAGEKLLKQGENLINRALNASTFKRVVFAGYLIASADGDFDNDEKKALVELMKRQFPEFDINDIHDLVKECDDKVAFNHEMGIREILDEISLNDDPEDAKTIMRTCAFIGAADGEYDMEEKRMARSIAGCLKLSFREYGL